MAKKRGLASNRGLDALLGSIKKEKIIAGGLTDIAVKELPSHHLNLEANEQLPLENKAPHKNSQNDNQSVSSTDNDVSAKFSVEKTASETKAANKKTTKTASLDLFGNDHTTTNSEENIAELNLLHIDVSCLQRGKYQPRTDLGEEALQELATSIRQHGVMQPIVIRPLAQQSKGTHVTHEIIAGERRWRAAQIAGLSHIPAIIRPMSDDLAIALALIENIQREDLSIMEQAVALQRFHDEFGMSHAQIADVVGKARTTVSNLLRLNGLHDEVKKALNDKQMDMGHARSLLSLSKAQQPIIAKKIVNEQLTVRQTEQLVKDILNPKDTTTKEIDYDRLRLNQQLSEQLGAVVKIKGSSTGKGSIEIFYHSPDEFTALIGQLQHSN